MGSKRALEPRARPLANRLPNPNSGLILLKQGSQKFHCPMDLAIRCFCFCACVIVWTAEKIFEDGFHFSLVGFVGLAFVVAWATLQA